MKALLRYCKVDSGLLRSLPVVVALVLCFAAKISLANGHIFIEHLTNACTSQFFDLLDPKNPADDSLAQSSFQISKSPLFPIIQINVHKLVVDGCRLTINDESIYEPLTHEIKAPADIQKMDKNCDAQIATICSSPESTSASGLCEKNGTVRIYNKDTSRYSDRQGIDYCGLVQYNNIHAHCLLEISDQLTKFRANADHLQAAQTVVLGQEAQLNEAKCMEKNSADDLQGASEQIVTEIKPLQAGFDHAVAGLQLTQTQAQASGLSITPGYKQAVTVAAEGVQNLQTRIKKLSEISQNYTVVSSSLATSALSSAAASNGLGSTLLPGAIMLGAAALPFVLNGGGAGSNMTTPMIGPNPGGFVSGFNAPSNFNRNSNIPVKTGASTNANGLKAATKALGSATKVGSAATPVNAASTTSLANGVLAGSKMATASTAPANNPTSGMGNSPGHDEKNKDNAKSNDKKAPGSMALFEGGGNGGRSGGGLNQSSGESSQSLDNIFKGLLDSAGILRSPTASEGNLPETGNSDVSLWERVQSRISAQAESGNIAGPSKKQ